MYKKNIFGKRNILYNIGKKINNAIQIRLLDDIVELITDFICNEISENKIFSVKNFGTFYQSSQKSRLIWSNSQQEEVLSRSSQKVKFSPHDTFSKLLKSKRKLILSTFKNEKGQTDKEKRSQVT